LLVPEYRSCDLQRYQYGKKISVASAWLFLSRL